MVWDIQDTRGCVKRLKKSACRRYLKSITTHINIWSNLDKKTVNAKGVLGFTEMRQHKHKFFFPVKHK